MQSLPHQKRITFTNFLKNAISTQKKFSVFEMIFSRQQNSWGYSSP